MTDDEEEGRFGDVEPSTMVVANDDSRHQELIEAARRASSQSLPATAPSAPVATPTAAPTRAEPPARASSAPSKARSGVIDVPVGDSSGRSMRTALVIGGLAIAGIVVAGFALHWW